MDQTEFASRVTQIRENLAVVRRNIAEAARRSGRDPEDVRLVAVTKQVPLDMVRAGIEAGLTCFGENYPEQAVEKILALQSEQKIQWHMIGHIQSRKSRTVCQHFDSVHSVDRMKIIRHLDKYCHELSRVMPVLVEVNISGEDSKYGWSAWDEHAWGQLVPPFREMTQAENLDVQGLMSMPPFYDDPKKNRPLYQKLRRLQAFLREEVPQSKWNELSIGTSFDYPVAVEEGATMVRIGTQLFGSRPVM